MSDQISGLNKLDDQPGRLTVEIGEGWLSRFEAAGLRVGDIVVSEQMAGTPIAVRFNSNYLAQGEIVVLGSGNNQTGTAIFGLRMLSLSPEHQPRIQPERGDDITELLPFTIRLAEVEYSLSELTGLGPQSLIHLDTPCDLADNASLILAGHHLGRGIVVVVGEKLGLRVTSLAGTVAASGEIRTTGCRLPVGDSQDGAKIYDFRRPDCVTRPMIERLGAIHAEFLRSLQMIFPEAERIKLHAVDQLTFGEWVASKRPGENRIHLLETSLGSTSPQAGTNRTKVPAKLCLSPAHPHYPAFDSGFEALIRQGLQQSSIKSDKRLCFLSAPPSFDRNFGAGPRLEQTLACLRNGWKRWADLGFATTKQLAPGWAPAEALQHSGEHDMILMATFTTQTPAGPEWMELIYPLLSLRKLTRIFG